MYSGQRKKEFGSRCAFICVLVCFLSVCTVALSEEDPVAKALQPVRKLWRSRKYKSAQEKLQKLKQKNETIKNSDITAIVGRQLPGIASLVKAGTEGFNDKIGKEFPLRLTNGTGIEGKLLGVSESELRMQLGEGSSANEIKIEVDNVRIGRIIKLAARKYPPDVGANQALFAVAYAMGGVLDSAEKALSRARKAGYQPTDEAKFVNMEKAWQKTQEQSRQTKKENNGKNKEKKGTQEKDEESNKPDPFRGAVLAFSFNNGRFFKKNDSMHVRDLSGHSNHGRIVGARPAKSPIGRAIWFTESGSGVIVENEPVLQVTGNMTISFWMYPAKLGARRNPYNKAYGGEGTVTLEKNGQLTFYYGRSGGNGGPYGSYKMPKKLKPKQWYHCVIVRNVDKSRVRWYLNGKKVAENMTKHKKARPSDSPLILGKGYAGNFMGILDEVAVWDRALSAAAVKQLFRYSKSGKSYCEAIGQAAAK